MAGTPQPVPAVQGEGEENFEGNGRRVDVLGEPEENNGLFVMPYCFMLK